MPINSKRIRALSTKNATKNILTRDEILSILGGAIEQQAQKVKTGRVRNKELFTQKLRSLRALGYISNIYFMALRDKELTDVMKQLEELEKLAKTQDVD